MICLYSDVRTGCTGGSRAHFIPEALGGTRAGEDSSCASCNAFHGSETELPLRNLLGELFWELGPLMPGRLRDRSEPRRTRDGGWKVRREPGGIIGLPTINIAERGKRVVIRGPVGSEEDIRRLAERFGATEARWRFESFAPLIPEVDVGHFTLTPTSLRRAAAKVLLEGLDILGGRDIARSRPLMWLRHFVTHGPSGQPEPAILPWAALGAELDRVFATPRTVEFTNRVVIVRERGRTFGFLQIGGTLPLVVDMGLSAGDLPPDRSIIYEKGLLRARPHVVESVVEGAVLPYRAVEWARFPLVSVAAVETAVTKFHQSLLEASGKANVLVDLMDDEILKETLESFLLNPLVRGGYRRTPAGAALEDALRIRFRLTGIPESEWDSVREAPERARLNIRAASRKLQRRVVPTPDEMREFLALFRSELVRLVEQYGQPRNLRAEFSVTRLRRSQRRGAGFGGRPARSGRGAAVVPKAVIFNSL